MRRTRSRNGAGGWSNDRPRRAGGARPARAKRWRLQLFRGVAVRDVETMPSPNLGLFFGATFALTWTSWWVAHALSGGALTSRGPWLVLVYLGVFSPGIVALSITWFRDGRGGVSRLLSGLVRWRVAARWYVLALGFTLAIKLGGAVLYRLLFDAWPTFGETPLILMLAATLLSTLALGQAGEEIGWRGYALPRLAQRLGVRTASIVLGVVWAVWHFPLFVFLGTSTTGQSFPVYVAQVTAISVVMTWLYFGTQGSLLLTMLMHAAINNTKDIVPSAEVGATQPFALSASPMAWISLSLLWLCALIVLARMPRLVGVAADGDPRQSGRGD